MRRRLSHDDGSTLPFVVAFGMLGLALVLVAAAASSLYLERKQLFTLADGAALVGAEAFELDDVEVTDGMPQLRLQPADVHRDVTAFLASTPNTGFEGLVLEQATSPDGRSATVTVSAIWHPPLVTVFFPDGLRIEATATARVVYG